MVTPLHPAQSANSASMLSAPRCSAAHEEDMTSCEGGRAVVRIVDRCGMEVTGCVQHAAVLYASLVGARVYPTPGHHGAATEVFIRAQTLAPFAWQHAA